MKKAVHEIVLIPLDQSLVHQDSSLPPSMPATEPVTAKNRDGSIGFKGLPSEEMMKGGNMTVRIHNNVEGIDDA